MSNFEIYRRTLVFSGHRLLLDLIAVLAVAGCIFFGMMIAPDAVLGLGIGAAVGLLIFFLIVHFVGYLYQAGQIAMMTRAITENSLPKDVVGEGKAAVKARFATVTAYYAISGAIKGIFYEITQGINSLAKLGGSAGESVGDTISGIINIAVSYLCDCCLGWVFYRSDEGSFRGTCEGAVLFFKNWKTLLKNMGRVIGIGIASFVVIGGALTFGFYRLMGRFPAFVTALTKAMAEADSNIDLSDPTVALLVISMLFGILCWSIIHSVLVRPFVLVGVLRNFIEAGRASQPEEANFAELDKVSGKFRKAHEKANAQAGTPAAA